MQNVTIRMPEELADEIDAEAEANDESRSEYIRRLLRERHEHDQSVSESEYQRLREQYEALLGRVDDLEETKQWQRTQIDRLQNEKEILIQAREETNELVKYVESSWFRRAWWKIAGKRD